MGGRIRGDATGGSMGGGVSGSSSLAAGIPGMATQHGYQDMGPRIRTIR